MNELISVEEQDNLTQCNKKVERGMEAAHHGWSHDEGGRCNTEERRKYSFRELVIGFNKATPMKAEEDEGEISHDDDAVDDDEEGQWFSLGITEEKPEL